MAERQSVGQAQAGRGAKQLAPIEPAERDTLLEQLRRRSIAAVDVQVVEQLLKAMSQDELNRNLKLLGAAGHPLLASRHAARSTRARYISDQLRHDSPKLWAFVDEAVLAAYAAELGDDFAAPSQGQVWEATTTVLRELPDCLVTKSLVEMVVDGVDAADQISHVLAEHPGFAQMRSASAGNG